ncbi:myosin-binding striated muscle assembly central-domain-containing protein [Dactylonectria macrodidyma]|uniref:Myosin-binding striated muscle assembly central-domain-containing protein n=1 Tax=Dactylonectria macrodidyma TaxID=307937 RepID=A0A9P9J469_9HYPO|nr:myosin-binding striated muscle assembly central-domain-containing protein [Dactylonectria macrodidyma]
MAPNNEPDDNAQAPASAVVPAPTPTPAPSIEDQTLIVFARLMEGGQEDNETCRDLDELTKLLNDDFEARQKDQSRESICKLIDGDCVDTVLCYLDMRQPEIVRGHATLSTSAYLKAAGDEGSKMLSTFFFDRVRRGTYDDYIVAFCVAASTFPIVPDLTAGMFLNEGFLSTLGPLMRRKWKSRKVETACLEMLNAACMNSQCREAINKYCTEWLEEVVDQDLNEIVRSTNADPNLQSDGGSVTMRRHSEQVQYLAAVILAKLRAVPIKTAPGDASQSSRIEPAVTTIEELSGMFTKMILRDEDHGRQHSIEGLAYASLQPKVKESVANNSELLEKLVKTLSDAQPRSPTTYGALSIFVNLTKYLPNMTDEQKKMSQLKAYANAAGKLAGPDPLDSDDVVAKRCKLVFDAGLVPVLVTHSKNGSPASLSLTIAIIFALSVTKTLHGQLAQQGAIRLLLASWMTLAQTEPARRLAAQALARILISTNPTLIFGGNRNIPVSAAVRPLVSIIPPDPAAETRDLLPSFEALMALTNLASMNDDDMRRAIISTAWSHIEEQLLSSNALVSKAAVELVCNLVQAPEAIALYAEETAKARNRLNILLALSDAEDAGTRSAAGGALASLTTFEPVVRGVLHRERGIKVILGMCVDDDENIRHRGVFVVLNLVSVEGDTGKLAREKIKDEDGVNTLKECLKKSRRPEVLGVTAQALKALLEQK